MLPHRWVEASTLVAAAITLASCRSRKTEHDDSTPPSANIPRLCSGGSRDVPTALARIEKAHQARAAEVATLLQGATRRSVGERAVEELTRYPTCTPSTDALVLERTSRALDAFFARKDVKPHGDRRPSARIRVGCEEDGRLPVSVELAVGIGESFAATYQVDARNLEVLVDGPLLAHADLDGDGRRDLVWNKPSGRGSRIAIRFARTGRSQTTPVEVSEVEDSDYSYVAAPTLTSAFALVSVHRSSLGSRTIEQRSRWDGKRFAVVERLDDDFEGRYNAAHERELAVLDDPIFGGFGKLRQGLEQCAVVGSSDASCAALFEEATRTLTLGGVAEPEARAALRTYLGWKACGSERPEHAGAAPAVPEAFDVDRHCASLRTIAGYMNVVPGWASDAGYLRHFDRDGGSDPFAYGDDVVAERADDDAGRSGRARGKEIPSGFVACEHASTTAITRRNGATYEGTSAPIPNEEARASRFAELASVWRRCLASSGLKEVRPPTSGGLRVLTFSRPGPASDHRSCSLDARGPVLRIVCARFEGDD